jgi:hypothetical protein
VAESGSFSNPHLKGMNEKGRTAKNEGIKMGVLDGQSIWLFFISVRVGIHEIKKMPNLGKIKSIQNQWSYYEKMEFSNNSYGEYYFIDIPFC